MKMKWLLSLSFLTVSLVTGCGGDESTDGSEGDAIELASTLQSESEKEVFEGLIDDFEKETGNNVDVSFPGSEYESQLRVMMASNEMPDLFDTHGWAQQRYGDYTEDLSDEEWSNRINESFDTILWDENDKLYAFPLNEARDGLVYNETLLEGKGIEPPTTYDEFLEAVRTLKEEVDGDIIPLFLSSQGLGGIDQFTGHLATAQLTTDEENNYQKSLKDGTFDWTNYTAVPKKIKQLQDEELINEDATTANGSQAVNLMAQNQIAFVFPGGAGGSFGLDVSDLNPDVQIGTVPMPAIHKGDEPAWIGGERNTLALWKDSDKKDEAKEFLEFMSQEENAKKIAEATSAPSGLKDVEPNTYYSDYFEKYSETDVEPYFDREYFPSGMWDIMLTTGEELLSDSLTPEQVSEEMSSQYERLRNEAGIEEGENIEEADEPELSEEEEEEAEKLED